MRRAATITRLTAVLICLTLAGGPPISADDAPAGSMDADVSQLRDLVGSWHGVGQPRRGSNRGAWRESCQWQFKFVEGKPRLEGRVENGRWIETATLAATKTAGEWELRVETPEEKGARAYLGKWNEDGALVLDAAEPQDNEPDRISLRIVAGGDRLVVLYESRSATGRFARLAEVGFTRDGANFAAATYPVCVVTGGRGTIAVEHKGQTYYVCCGGCRDLFLESPDETIAEYERQKSEAAKKKAAGEGP